MNENEQDNKVERPQFKEYFFRSRLKRVPKEVLKKFVSSQAGEGEQDNIKKASQGALIERILLDHELRSDNRDFNLNFNKFLRDYFFSAKESVYLIQIPNQQAVIDWVNSWRDNRYIGQRYHFSKHTHIFLQERFLQVEQEKIPFPSEVILLVANSTTPKAIPSGMELVEYFPTLEIELIFRKGINLMEARGELGVILDFINTAILDSHNPLVQASSFFVGEREDARARAITKQIGKSIKIEALRAALKGSYESISSPVKGDKTSRIQASFEGLSDLEDETDPLIKPLLTTLIKDQDTSRISFTHNGARYSFGITKSGGLTFRQYAPEEVITYVVSKINAL